MAVDVRLHAHAPDQPPAVKLPISERFVSLQGEGKLTGVPSAFIRVAGCNMRCSWCDTPESSWDPVGEPTTIGTLSRWALGTGLRHAVLTGGEPMLFSGVGALAARLRDAGMHITYETAGTIDRDWPTDLLSVSPKLSNSTPINDPRDPDGTWADRHERVRRDLTPMRSLLGRAIASRTEVQLKFVVTSERDLMEIRSLLDALRLSIRPQDVLLMPEGTATPRPETVAWIVDACRAHGYRFAHRLHIELFGHTRGT